MKNNNKKAARIFKALYLSVAISSLSAVPGKAISAELDDAQEVLQEFPVVLTASRLLQPLAEAPNAMTVIDRDMIKASGFRTISDLFRLVPGMYVGAVDGYRPIVGYHGATDQYSRRMQVLIDGRSVYLPPFSNVDWEDIPIHISDIERIEVVRGPSAASHGANSLNGVINIITRDASSLNGTTIIASSGEVGAADLVAQHGKTGEKFDYRLTAGYRTDHGFDNSILNDSSATRIFNWRGNFHPNHVDNLGIQLGISSSVQGLGVAGRSDSDPFREADTKNHFEQIRWQHAMNDADEFSLQYYHIFRKYSDAIPPGSTEVDRHEIELQHTVQLGESNRLVWGGGARYDYAISPMNLYVPQSNYQTRVFFHDEWRATTKTIINAGSMYENDGMGHFNSSPRLSVNFHVTPAHTLRASTSVAYRNPAIMEEKANSTLSGTSPLWISNGGVKPEKIISREFGYLGEIPSMRLSLDARLYSDQISDIIYTDPTSWSPTRKYSFANLLEASQRGFEATVKHRWSDSNSVVINYARQMMDCNISGDLTLQLLTSELQKVANQCTGLVPWNSGSLLLVQQVTDNVQFSMGYYYQSEMMLIYTQAPETRKQRIDMRISKSFRNISEGIGSGEVALVVQNAFQDNGTNYAQFDQTRYMVFNRRAYVTATINF